MEECLRASATRIEIDVHSMADGEYLVCHANRLEEATTSRGAVGRLTRHEALELRRNDDAGSRPPLLSEVIALAQHYEAELQLDLKDWRPLTPHRIDALVALVAPLGERVLVSSGQDWNLRAIARRAPRLRLGFDPNHYFASGDPRETPLPTRLGAHGYRDDHPLAIGRAQPLADYLRERIDVMAAQCPFAAEWFINYRLLLQAEADGVPMAELLHERGVAVNAWTLDYDGEASLGKLRRLAATGIDRITTNTARQLVEALAN
jgi:glycerophosphoryl diester phosphodiesterase